MRFLFLTAILFALPTFALSQSTSPNPDMFITSILPKLQLQGGGEDNIITFSEFPVGTSITNQYADKGIIFGGDSPFVSNDRSNPTSPVLSGSPQFMGSIEGTFVDPEDRETPIIVESFSLDMGFFDNFGSTRIEWFDPEGNKLGQRTNSQLGIERFEITGGNIASWKVSIIEDEPAGYAIDNVTIDLVQASILFREKFDREKDGTWGLEDDFVPGFDHTAFHINDTVYESHPGYIHAPDTYVSEDGRTIALVEDIDGVQAEHTRATFEHDATRPGRENSPVIDFEEIPISKGLADKMKDIIEAKMREGARFQRISFDSLQSIEETLSPAAQKGGDGTFTCVGLVEYASEQAGHNNGEGFVRNALESFFLA